MWRIAVLLTLLSSLSSSSTQNCTGQGNLYSDTNQCECYQCFQGVQCEQQVDPCVVQATQGQPSVFQEYWDANPVQFESIIPVDYRTGYQEYNQPIPPPGTLNDTYGITGVLRAAISGVHSLANNAKTDDKWIVLGDGCSELIAAVQYAFASLKQAPVHVFAQVPYYDGYEMFASFGFANLSFSPSLNLENSTVLEFVTYPNNPDGLWRQPYYTNSLATVYDMVYYWPSLVEIDEQLDHDIMLFSMSKLTGHAGSRFGWALVRNPIVAGLMQDFVSGVHIGVSIESQYRTFRTLSQIVSTQGAMFDFIRDKMTDRWDNFQALFDLQTTSPPRFTLLSQPGTFYAWIQCNWSTDTNCAAVFLTVGVAGESGSGFGASNSFVRLELVQYTPVFNILMSNLKSLFTT